MTTQPSLDPLQARVLDAAREEHLYEADDLILVAVSGGLDSVVLLHVLASLRGRGGPRIEAVHLDHMLRGAAAREDAEFVHETCRRLGVALHRSRANVRLRAAHRGTGIEEEGRRARHLFWRRVCLQRNAVAVATGHHAGDQVETVLFRLGRGAGRRGLSGMRPSSEIDGLRVVRPLLDVERSELEAYARQHDLAWSEDATNQLLDPVRNRIRHVVMPALEAAFGSRVGASIRRAAEVLAEEDAWIEEEASRALETIAEGNGLSLVRLAAVPDALRLRVLRRWVRDRTALRLDRAASLRLAALAAGGRRPASLAIGRDLRCARAYGLLRLYRHAPCLPPPVSISLPGVGVMPGTGFRVTCRAIRRDAWSALRARDSLGGPTEGVDLDRTGPSGVLRVAEAGDRLRPLGMDGRRKLQDIFTDSKIPRQERRLWPVLECGGRIVWAVGLRIDHAYRVREDTARIGLLRFVNRPAPWI